MVVQQSLTIKSMLIKELTTLLNLSPFKVMMVYLFNGLLIKLMNLILKQVKYTLLRFLPLTILEKVH
jgi:hypothetical protein